MMGDDEGDYDREKPAHKVELDSFYMGQYPVTQALWLAVMGENPSYFKGPKRPVDQVSWEDVHVFLQKLNKKLKLEGDNTYRLPTEAEWEYAARGGKYRKEKKYAGSEEIRKVAWFTRNSQGQTHPICLKAPNELGLYDMSGNLEEWCEDWYDRKYYEICHKEAVVKNPKGPESGRGRVNRGGGWLSYDLYARVANRGRWFPVGRGRGLGFRLARTV